MPDCKNCNYRILLARLCDIHVDYRDCDKYDPELCEKEEENHGE